MSDSEAEETDTDDDCYAFDALEAYNTAERKGDLEASQVGAPHPARSDEQR